MLSKRGLFTTILWVGFLVGYLDITAAIFNFMFTSAGSPLVIFRYIASAVFGKSAFSAPNMVTYGFLFHFLIAYSFTLVFFLVYPSLPFLAKSRLLTGLLYGSFVWCIMNLVVVPFSRIGSYPAANGKTVIQLLILILAIGLPLSYLAHWYYKPRLTR